MVIRANHTSFLEFYKYVTKGFITLITDEIHDWNDYDIAPGVYNLMSEKPDASICKILQPEQQFHESWGSDDNKNSHLELKGGIHYNPQNQNEKLYLCVIMLYQQWLGIVIVMTEK